MGQQTLGSPPKFEDKQRSFKAPTFVGTGEAGYEARMDPRLVKAQKAALKGSKKVAGKGYDTELITERNDVSNVASGASGGATIGSFWGPVGTAIGAVVGGVVGGIAGLLS
jgi:hypothetical protein